MTINQAAGQADPTSASPINFTVTFSETVTGFAASDMSFAGARRAAPDGDGDRERDHVQRGGVGDDGDRHRRGERPGRGGDGCGGQREPCVDEHGQYRGVQRIERQLASGTRSLRLVLISRPPWYFFLMAICWLVRSAEPFDALSPPYTQIEPTPFLQITNIGHKFANQGLYTIALDPNFATNHYIYVFYTLGSPNHDRLSRFTVNDDADGSRWERKGPLRRSGRQRSRSPRRRDHVRQ